MTLGAKLEQALAALGAFSSGEQVVEIDEGTQKLSCELTALDTLACAFTRLALADDALTSLSADELKHTAGKLSSRLTYLLEPISPIETDAHGCVVQLRSNPPQKDSDRTSYYELLVARSGQISLTRYTRAAGQPRTVVPAQVTREVLARLAGDLATATS